MKRKNTQIFLIRIWKEDPKGENWRGNIQNVRTGQNITVANINEMAELFRRYFSEEAKPRLEPEKGLR